MNLFLNIAKNVMRIYAFIVKTSINLIIFMTLKKY